MLLAIDIGNTNINFGLFKDKRLLKKFTLPTAEDKYHSRLKRLLANEKGLIKDIIICSVVPKSCRLLIKDLKGLFAKNPVIIGKGLRAPIKNLYRNPGQVGQDRLVNAYAGSRLYGAPLIIVDFGTAITFDVISKNKEYLGGLIAPGLSISLQALRQNTALLPKVDLAAPEEFIGRNTKNSMLSGVIYGFAALTDDLANRIKRIIGKNAKVIGTGGNIQLIAKFCRTIDKINPDLTLQGVSFLSSVKK